MTITPTSVLTAFVLAGLLAPLAPARAQQPRGEAPRAAAAPPRPAAGSPWANDDYRLGPGDKLRVEVYGEPQLSQSLQVRPDGKITLPLVGDMAATGRSPMELRDAIASSLKEYITNPVVTVIVVEATAAQIFVVGEVGSPGAQVMRGPMTVLQALAQAGGLKEFADADDIHILRTSSTGMQQTIAFDYKEAIKGRRAPLYLQPGDTLVVP